MKVPLTLCLIAFKTGLATGFVCEMGYVPAKDKQCYRKSEKETAVRKMYLEIILHAKISFQYSLNL